MIFYQNWSDTSTVLFNQKQISTGRIQPDWKHEAEGKNEPTSLNTVKTESLLPQVI